MISSDHLYRIHLLGSFFIIFSTFGVQVCKPNEFDLMIVATPPCEAHYVPCSPDYCSLEIAANKRAAMSELLTDGKWLSPKAVKAHVSKMLPKALQQFSLSRTSGKLSAFSACINAPFYLSDICLSLLRK